MTDAALLIRLARARADYSAELHFAPSSSRPVIEKVEDVYYTDDGRRKTAWINDPKGSDVSQVGQTLSSRMQRLLQRSYGSEMAVHRALQDLPGWCWRRHIDKGEPLHLEREGRTFCADMTRSVVITGYGEQGIDEAWMPELRNRYYERLIRRAAEKEGLEYEQGAQFISAALVTMDRWMQEWAAATAA